METTPLLVISKGSLNHYLWGVSESRHRSLSEHEIRVIYNFSYAIANNILQLGKTYRSLIMIHKSLRCQFIFLVSN